MTEPQAVLDADVLEAVHAALDNDDRLALQGGVRPRHVAKHCSLEASTLRTRLNALVGEDELLRVWGADREQSGYPARVGYLPADHPDATSPFQVPSPDQ